MDLVDFLLAEQEKPRVAIAFKVPTAREVRKWLQATAGLVDEQYTVLSAAQQKYAVADLVYGVEYGTVDKRYPRGRTLAENRRRERDPIAEERLPRC